MSKKDDVIEASGVVVEALPNAQFKVTCSFIGQDENELHQNITG